jgi:hypothetical protein
MLEYIDFERDTKKGERREPIRKAGPFLQCRPDTS